MNRNGKDKLRIAFLRHGPTEWNEQGRIQGRIDVALSQAGRAKMARLLPPDGFELARAYVSPLKRARETAQLLGITNVTVDDRLSEHHWGEWEGLTREEILARDGEDAFVRAGSGIDFCPKGGESTNELVLRLSSFLHDVASQDGDAIAITHRGILRSAYALATNWDMTSPMPAKLDLSQALVLDLGKDRTAHIAAMNVPLRSKTAGGV